MMYYMNETVYENEETAVKDAIKYLEDFAEEEEGEDLDIEVTAFDHGVMEVIAHYNIECMQMYGAWHYGEVVARERYYYEEAEKVVEIVEFDEEEEEF